MRQPLRVLERIDEVETVAQRRLMAVPSVLVGLLSMSADDRPAK